MGIVEYFSLLVHGSFPQEAFLKWIEINDPPNEEGPGEPYTKWFDPKDVLMKAVFCFFLPLFPALLLICATLLLKRPGALGFWFLWMTFGAGIFFFLVSYISAVVRFKKNLNQFLKDYDHLKELLGRFPESIQEIEPDINKKMVSIARSILEIEQGSRSKLTEAMLADEHTKMRSAEHCVGKFGFATSPWEKYFDEARGHV